MDGTNKTETLYQGENMKKNQIRLSLILLFLFAIPLFAWEEEERPSLLSQDLPFQATFSFASAFPKGEFRDHLDKDGLGFSLLFGYRLNDSPVIIGADFTYIIYGSESRNEYFDNIPDVLVNVENTNNIVQGLAFLRLQPERHAAFRPYADLLFGFNYLFTETSIQDADSWDWDDEIASDVNFSDTSLVYGFGAGTQILLGGGRQSHRGKRSAEFLLDVKARYLIGGNARYLQEGSILRDGNNITYLYDESNTDLFSVQAGLTINF